MSIVKNFDLSEMEQMVSEQTDVYNNLVHQVLTSFFDILAQGVALKEYGEVEGLGSFRIVTLKPTSGIDPQGDPFSVGDRVTIEFNPFEPFREKVEATTGLKCIR